MSNDNILNRALDVAVTLILGTTKLAWTACCDATPFVEADPKPRVTAKLGPKGWAFKAVGPTVETIEQAIVKMLGSVVYRVLYQEPGKKGGKVPAHAMERGAKAWARVKSDLGLDAETFKRAAEVLILKARENKDGGKLTTYTFERNGIAFALAFGKAAHEGAKASKMFEFLKANGFTVTEGKIKAAKSEPEVSEAMKALDARLTASTKVSRRTLEAVNQ